MPLRAVIFDFDGVLADTEPLHLQAWQEVLAEEGITLTAADYFLRYLGFDDETMVRAVGAEEKRPWSEAQVKDHVARKGRRFEAELAVRNVLFPGAELTVRRLSDAVPLAVASGALRGEIEIVLERAGLRPFFRAIVAAGEVARSKPAPDPYARAVTLLAPFLPYSSPNPNGRGIVAIEDSRWGVASAQAAGLKCVAVAHTYAGRELRAADLVVDKLSDVTLDALAKLCDI